MAGKKEKLINLEYLKTMSGNDPGIIKEMIDVFIGQIPDFVKEMQELYDKGDWTNLALLAHKTKSSVAIMGMNKLVDMLKEFELLAREGKSTEKYAAFIQQFTKNTQQAINELRNLY